MSEQIHSQIDSSNKSYDQQETATFLEHSQLVGEWYQTFIQSLVGWQSDELPDLTTLPENLRTRLESITQVAQQFFTEQATRFEQQNMTAEDLLLQLGVFNDLEKRALLADTSKYKLTVFSPGIYGVLIDQDLYFKLQLTSSAQAVAYTLPHPKISFATYRIAPDRSIDTPYFRENFPHEIHHLAWKVAQRKNLVPSSEPHTLRSLGFWMYQDEVLANLAANHYPKGYAHFQSDSPEMIQLVADNPEIIANIREDMGKLNELFYDLWEQLEPHGTFQIKDFILSVICSTSFAELETNAHKIMQIFAIHQK